MNISALEKVALSVRTMSMDAIQKANSGHPGLPLGCAELAAVLYGELLKHNPADPSWVDRDRFVLSAGHGSMLLYSILHLSGYDLTMDDIKSFRQLGSKCPGHPEYGVTPGVEATSGPLGQGISMAVGMALAESVLAAKFNTEDFKVVDHYTYALVGEGCLMEGVSSEASSFAGTNKLGKLIVYYDENRISIDGPTSIAFGEDIAARYRAYGWQVLEGSMYDMNQIAALTAEAKADDRPSLIMLKSVIGKGAPTVAGSAKAHGAPIGAEGVAAAKKELGIDPETQFYAAPEAYSYFEEKRKLFADAEASWKKTFDAWAAAYPEKKAEWDAYWSGAVSSYELPVYKPGESLATRNASGAFMKSFTNACKNIIGGSADLTGPNLTQIGDGSGVYSPENRTGRYIHFGIREFAMAAICNGVILHGGLRSFCGTFLVFADYLRPAVRMSALMKLPVVYVFTHDSIYVGEDGPTHQPTETVDSLRLIPGVKVLRPGDAEETIEAWKIAAEEKNCPVCLILTRQKVPVFAKEDSAWKENIKNGAYIVREGSAKPDVTVFASGSEVALSLDAAEKAKGKSVRVVSVLDRESLKAKGRKFINELAGGASKIIVAEAGSRLGWEDIASSEDCLFCIDRFGLSAPGDVVAQALGFTAENLAKVIEK